MTFRRVDRPSSHFSRGWQLWLRKILIGLSIILLYPARAAECPEPKTGTKHAPIFSPPLSVVVIGAGRLQFYSAPHLGCIMNRIFVIPKDELIAYAQSNGGWSSVTYSNPRTGDNVSGWVKSSRLKKTGAVGPTN